MLHRDVKPANIVLASNGSKLLDFGIAKPVQDTAATIPEVTSPGTFLGTPS
jgi:serine/threonine protein kinase